MATELASGYVSLTVKLAKGGMADVTKEVKKAGTEGGAVYSDEFNKKVGEQVGKKLPDTIGKSTKSGGGLAKAAKEAADEFGKGFRDGVDQALGKSGGGGSLPDAVGKAARTGGGLAKAAKEAAEEFGKGFRDGVKDAIKSGDIEGALEPINDKVKSTTELIRSIGSATGMDTSGIDSLSSKITGVLDDVGGRAGDAQTSFRNLNQQLEDLGKKGEGGTFDRVASKVGLIADAVNTVNDIKAQSEDADAWADEHISFIHWANQYTPDKLGRMARERVDAFMSNISTDISTSPGSPRFGPAQPTAPKQPPPAPPSPGRRAGGGGISGPGGPTSDIIPIWASNGEYVLPADVAAKMGGPRVLDAFVKGLHGYAGGGALGDAGGLLPFTSELRALVKQSFPMITDIGGYRSPDGYNEHSSGRALDVMIPNWNSPAGIALGNQIAAWALSIPGVNRIMWQQSIQYRGGQPKRIEDRGSPTQNHMDHVHIFTEANPPGAHPSASLPSVPSVGGGAGPSISSGGGGGGGGGATPALPDKLAADLGSSNPYIVLDAVNKARQLVGADQKQLDDKSIAAVRNILPDFGALGDIGVGGLRETFLPPGFNDPTQGSTMKSVGALLKWIGGIVPDKSGVVKGILGGVGSGITGDFSGAYSSVMGAIPAPFGTGPAPQAQDFAAGVDAGAPGAAPANAPAPTVDNSITIGKTGDGVDQALAASKKQQQVNSSVSFANRKIITGAG